MTITHIRNKKCTKCKHHQDVDVVCQLGRSGIAAMFPDPDDPECYDSKIVVVTSRQNSDNFQHMLDGHLRDAGINPAVCYFTAAIKCRNFDMNISRGDVKACAPYLHDEITAVAPEWVLTMGNEALQAVAGKSGIMKYRGRIIDQLGYKILPTISPAAVSRNPGQIGSYMADLRLLGREMSGQKSEVPLPTIHYILTAEKYKKLKRALKLADLVSFDIETTRDGEFDPNAKIVSISGTLVIDGKLLVWAMPLYHPQSPFRKSWIKVVEQLVPLMQRCQKRIAQNGKFDCRWLQRFSGAKINLTFDTMLASHLLDENREKGLKPQGASRLGVAPWGIDTKNLLSTPIMEVLKYNALDTYYAYQIYLLLRKELQDNPRLLRIFKFITMPAANLLIDVEQRGAWVDPEKLATNGKIARDMLAEIDKQLLKHVPEPGTGNWPKMGKREKLAVVNFNPSNFSKWFLFEHLGMPVLARGKPTEKNPKGMPSMAEDVLKELRGEHPVIELMLKRVTWNKMVSAFFNAYDELTDAQNRIHTTFKIAGTVTGRLSSGKADAEKVSGGKPTRGVNLQQVPRDELVRGLFGAPPGYTFVEADFSQVELRIAAYLSRDRTMLQLYQQGEDIHAATASWVLGVPRSKVTKDDRKKAKAVNFGFVYGMGWRKFIYTAFEKYDLRFTEDEAKAIRRAFFEQFAGLQAWHARQRRLVNENRRVQNPIGRIRHLPDIDSPEEGVRAEAERQAINSPVQSFGSDLCMLSMILIDAEFKRLEIDSHTIGTVHDALLFEIKHEDVADALPVIKSTMETLPLDKMFGCHLDVPIIADIKVGTHWGGAEEITEEEVFDWRR